LVKVNVFAGLVVPTVRVGYVALPGVSVTGTMPVPDSATVCGLFAASSLIVSVPVNGPSCVGVKTTPILHFLPTASEPAQVFAETAKFPLVVTLLNITGAVPELVTVMFFAALLVLIACLAKVSEVRESVTAPPPPCPNSRLKTVPHPLPQLLLVPPCSVVP